MATNLASTSTAPIGAHCMTPSQLSDFIDAVTALDAHLLRSVKALRNNEWKRPATKQIADYRVRELVVFFILLYYFSWMFN